MYRSSQYSFDVYSTSCSLLIYIVIILESDLNKNSHFVKCRRNNPFPISPPLLYLIAPFSLVLIYRKLKWAISMSPWLFTQTSCISSWRTMESLVSVYKSLLVLVFILVAIYSTRSCRNKYYTALYNKWTGWSVDSPSWSIPQTSIILFRVRFHCFERIWFL